MKHYYSRREAQQTKTFANRAEFVKVRRKVPVRRRVER